MMEQGSLQYNCRENHGRSMREEHEQSIDP